MLVKELKNLEFFGTADTKYIVPFYHRSYCWQDEQCKALLDELENLWEHENLHLNLGNYVVTPKDHGQNSSSSGEFFIIDGVQRVTSLCLIMFAMRNLLIEGKVEDEEDLVKKLDDYLLINGKPRLELIGRDNTYLKDIRDGLKDVDVADKIKTIYSEDNDEVGADLKKKEARDALPTIIRSYLFFEDYLRDTNYYFWYIIESLERISMTLSVVSTQDGVSQDGKGSNACVTNNSDDGQSAEFYGIHPAFAFVGLNSTGIEAQPEDLLRAFLFKSFSLEEQERLLHHYWTPIASYCNQDVLSLVKHYLAIKLDDFESNQDSKYMLIKLATYLTKKDQAKGLNSLLNLDLELKNVEDFLKELTEYAYCYSRLLNCESGYSDDVSYELNQVFKRLKYLSYKYNVVLKGLKDNLSIGLEFLYLKHKDKIKEKDVLTLFRFIESYVVRNYVVNFEMGATVFKNVLWLLRSTQEGNLKKLFCTDKVKEQDWAQGASDYLINVMSAFLDKYIGSDDFPKYARGEISEKQVNTKNNDHKFPSDWDFYRALIKQSLYDEQKYQSHMRYYIFSSLENSYGSDTVDWTKALEYEGREFHVEHIMPRTLDELWKEHLGADLWEITHELCLNRLGNLTLWKKKSNEELRNSSFADKKNHVDFGYLMSKSAMTQEVAKEERWGAAQILERGHNLAVKALKIWPCPVPQADGYFKFDLPNAFKKLYEKSENDGANGANSSRNEPSEKKPQPSASAASTAKQEQVKESDVKPSSKSEASTRSANYKSSAEWSGANKSRSNSSGSYDKAANDKLYTKISESLPRVERELFHLRRRYWEYAEDEIESVNDQNFPIKPNTTKGEAYNYLSGLTGNDEAVVSCSIADRPCVQLVLIQTDQNNSLSAKLISYLQGSEDRGRSVINNAAEELLGCPLEIEWLSFNGGENRYTIKAFHPEIEEFNEAQFDKIAQFHAHGAYVFYVGFQNCINRLSSKMS